MRNKAYLPLFFLFIIHCSLLTVCRAQQDGGISQEEKVQKAREHYASGKALLEQGDYKGADAQFKKAQGLLTQGSSLPAPEGLGQPAGRQAIPAEIASPPAAPGNGRASDTLSVARKAWEAAKRGAPEEAISFYQQAINTCAPNSDLYYNLALEYLKTKRFREAAQAFKRAVQLNQRDNDAYFNLAVLYESYLNDKKQALSYYSQYLKYASPGDNTAETKEWVRQIKKELKAR
ncbi:tetratricopeptide repeat protein [bacterium]|nr:MAG: tetratricopeptide repeat protein [bacterium]